MKQSGRILFCVGLMLGAWTANVAAQRGAPTAPAGTGAEPSDTVQGRFAVPAGFVRTAAAPGSFGEYLRGLKLRPRGAKVRYYDGREKEPGGVYLAVVDQSIGERDLHQCADAVMLLRAEYLFARQRYDAIHFNFVDGFRADYRKWLDGYRIRVSGERSMWVKSQPAGNSYAEFRKFMNVVFAYAGTLSLEKELRPVRKEEMRIGDVFIKGASPGHAVIVVDMAERRAENRVGENRMGEKLFMLAQSYMPAQQTQILLNPASAEASPWYPLSFSGELETPEWTFDEGQLRRFAGEE